MQHHICSAFPIQTMLCKTDALLLFRRLLLFLKPRVVFCGEVSLKSMSDSEGQKRKYNRGNKRSTGSRDRERKGGRKYTLCRS